MGPMCMIPGVKPDLKDEEADTDVINIVGSSKVTRSGRLFSPEISPPIVQKPIVITPTSTSATIPVHVPIITPVSESSDTRGKGITGEPTRRRRRRRLLLKPLGRR